MNIHTQPVTGPKKHRLFVAVPLFALCFFVSIGVGLYRSQASVLTPLVVEVREGSGVLLRHDIAVSGDATVMQSGAVLQLLRGTAMFAAENMLHIEASGFQLSSWHGVVEVTAGDHSLVVAALTAPAVIRHEDDMWIVPVGMQMTVKKSDADFADNLSGWIANRTPLPLPAHYLATHLPVAEQTQNLIPPMKTVTAARPLLPPLFGQIVRTEEARERAIAQDNTYRLQLLTESFAAGDAEHMQSLLLDERTTRSLHSSQGAALLPTLLSRALDLQMESLLLPLFLHNADNRMIAAYHPALRAHAWVIPWEHASSADRIASLVLLPISDRGADALPAVAVEQWGNAWQELLSQSDLAGSIADAVVPRLEADILTLDRLGFPERSRLYARTVAPVFMSHADHASESTKQAVVRLMEWSEGDAPVTTAVTIAEPIVEEVVIQPTNESAPDEHTAKTLEARVRTVMTEAHAMFTAQSSFTAQTAQRVLVQNVVFGTPNGDTLLSFEYNVETGMVVNIEKDGQMLPNSLSLEQYLEWVGEEKN